VTDLLNAVENVGVERVRRQGLPHGTAQQPEMSDGGGGEEGTPGECVTELASHGKDVLARFFAHTRPVIQHPGDCPDGDVCLLGNVTNRDQWSLAFASVY
jgi:hypothetical protein